jgi:hypothetical protein
VWNAIKYLGYGALAFDDHVSSRVHTVIACLLQCIGAPWLLVTDLLSALQVHEDLHCGAHAPGHRRVLGECITYATGAVVARSNKRVYRDVEQNNNMHFSVLQMKHRDSAVEAQVEAIKLRHRQRAISKEEAEKAIETIYFDAGSKGQTKHDKSGLGYWNVRIHSPFAF